jgi:hypothetical protein
VGLPAASLEGLHPSHSVLLVVAADVPGSADSHVRDQLDAELTVLGFVIFVELLGAVAGAVNRTLQLALLTIEIVNAEVVGGVQGNNMSSLPVLVSIASLQRYVLP